MKLDTAIEEAETLYSHVCVLMRHSNQSKKVTAPLWENVQNAASRFNAALQGERNVKIIENNSCKS